MASNWYYAGNGEKIGPVSSADLKKLASRGEIDDKTLIWKAGMEDWVAAGTAKGLFPDSPPELNPEDFPPPLPSAKKSVPLLPILVGIAAGLGALTVVFVVNQSSASQGTSTKDAGTAILGLIAFGVLTVASVMFYSIPSIIAFSRGHQNRVAILASNLLIGWTGLGWIACLVWSLTEVRATVQRHYHRHVR